MPRIPLLGGSYTAKSIIADAQRCINLYPEMNPENAQAPVNVTHYPRAGRTLLSSPPQIGRGRGLYTSTNGKLFLVVDLKLFYVDADWQYHFVGNLVTPAITPVSMSDNGTDMVLVDGSAQGYQITLDNPLATAAFAQITDPDFLGANFTAFLDSFLIFNQPNSPNFYSTLSYQIAFNGLDFGTATAWPGDFVSFGIVEREIWLFSAKKGEIWYNSGKEGFPFEAIPGVIVEHGCIAPYSVAVGDVNICWLSQSPEGSYMCMRGKQHGADRISTHAIENEWRQYPRVDDAIGSFFQQDGHLFYKLDFPTADKTWVFDFATTLWHEEGFLDPNGKLHRMRDSFVAFAYGKNVCLDWNTGALYLIDPDNFTDFGNPILCLRRMPHMIGDDEERITYRSLTADIEAGTTPNTIPVPFSLSPWSTGFSDGFGPPILVSPPLISLRTSLNRGNSYGNARTQTMGAAGHYNCRPTWRQLGYGYDVVFEVSWSSPMKTALNGVFLQYEKHMMDLNAQG